MDIGEAETDAIARANLIVAKMLQRPDQLQKVEQYKRRVQQKKLSVDAMLKTAMQSQLDGVRTGLSQLQTALEDLKEIKSSLSEIEDSFVKVPTLSKNLFLCREEYLKHSQYAAAMENLKHIFTVPDSIEKTKAYISEGKLLNAHQCIMDLENSRDELLYELHKLPHQNPNELRLLKEYFAGVESLSDDLSKQLWIILQRTLNTVRKEPTQIVTALRIIEREERNDNYVYNRKKMSGFSPPQRPKEWRKKAFEVLEKVVSQRIEGNQFEDRESNKNWLIRHLEVIRLMLIDDFKTIKMQCTTCFPPYYNIVTKYVEMYHRNLSSHLISIDEEGLEDNEYVTLLSWVLNTYPGKDLMGHPSINIDLTRLGPLLDNRTLDKLQKEYLENVSANYESWMTKALELEEQEWCRPEPPQHDGDSHYKTELPHLLHDMIRQNLDVASTISPEIQTRVLIISLIRGKDFAGKYSYAIARYKRAYFTDRSKIQYFTTYMIALANSCQAIMDIMISVKHQFWRPGSFGQFDKEVATNFDALTNAYQRLRDDICGYLMEEALTDLEVQFNALLTPQWLTNTEPMDTICLTINDYFQDYTHLHPKNFEYIVDICVTTIAERYITAILQKKMALKSDMDRRKVYNRIKQDAEKLQGVFDSVASETVRFNSHCEAIKCLADVISATDMDFLGLELHRLLGRYRDINSDHLTALLLFRGDIGRLEVRQRVVESLEEIKNQRTGPPPPKSIFSRVQAPTSIFP